MKGLGVGLLLVLGVLLTTASVQGQSGLRIEGYVYEDVNGNGVREAGEPGIGGVAVQAAGGGKATSSASGWYAVTVADGGGLVNFGVGVTPTVQPTPLPAAAYTPTATATATGTPAPRLMLTPEAGRPCGWLCVEGFPCWQVCAELAPRMWRDGDE